MAWVGHLRCRQQKYSGGRSNSLTPVASNFSFRHTSGSARRQLCKATYTIRRSALPSLATLALGLSIPITPTTDPSALALRLLGIRTSATVGWARFSAATGRLFVVDIAGSTAV